MPTIQYSARSAWLYVHKLFTSCIRRDPVSRDSIVDSDWLPATEWCQRYLPCCQPASDVAEDLGRFLCGVYRPGEWLWIDSNGRNGIPKRASLVVNFHRSVIIAELWRLEVARRQKVLIFFCVLEIRHLTVKFSKICWFKSFYRDTDRCVQILWNLADEKSVKLYVAYLTKKKQNFACLSSCRYCADRAQNTPMPASNNVLRVLQISSKSVYFRWSYSRTREHCQILS